MNKRRFKKNLGKIKRLTTGYTAMLNEQKEKSDEKGNPLESLTSKELREFGSDIRKDN